MKTYEELLECGNSDEKRGEFCAMAVRAFEGSTDYQQAQIADLYYRYHNVTIENFVKWIYTMSGRKIEDIYSASYKLKSGFFRRGIIQHANYLLGKGVIMDNLKDKESLGKNFDHQLIKAAKMAMVEKVSFGYWNNDHLEIFGYCCTPFHAGFCPVYSDDTAELMAGIRFRHKKVNNKTITTYTLFEIDGITEFAKVGRTDKVRITEPKHSYKKVNTTTEAEGSIKCEDENYNGRLPIVPLYASDTFESDLSIVRDKIDCYDLIESGLANVIDDNSEIYWLIKNAGGMKDPDIARMLHRLKVLRGAAIDSEDGGDLVPHTVDIPHDARDSLLDRLRADLHEDWMLADRKFLSAAQKTEQEIEMAYQGQDDYTDDLEFSVMEFCDTIFALAGIKSEYHFERNKAANKTEVTNMVVSAANYISPEAVINHLPFLSTEEKAEEIKNLAKENMDRFRNDGTGTDDSEEEEEE